MNKSFNLDKFKKNFHTITNLNKEILRMKNTIQTKLSHLKTVYSELSKKNNKKIFVFCLDSFFFQYRAFSVEMDNLDKFRTLLSNRMYCDYYKLYNLVSTYIKDNSADLNGDELEYKSFPIYKDLDTSHEYSNEDISSIHNMTLQFVNHLEMKYENTCEKITNYNDKNRGGFSVSNFLNTLDFENMILKQQITLYVNYISFFHVSQKKQFTRLLTKLQEFDAEVEENINVNFMSSIDDIDDSEPMNEFYSMDETGDTLETTEKDDVVIQNQDDVVIQNQNDVVIQNQDESDNGESDNGESNKTNETFSDDNNDFRIHTIRNPSNE